ncbi:MAG: hypothetical protein L0191_05705 [Acidobacteria bacterium]|nr:hypothetical protein [Acidobacteriota bacterium]MCI0567391.1 hypothetical protein [Acidobacteriota bacterium]
MPSYKALLLLPLLVIVSGCNDSGDTIIVNSDCGLIRSDLLGVYTVVFAPVTADLFNCSDPFFDGKTITVTSAPIDFPSVQVFASAFNTGFAFTDGAGPEGLFGNAETDSCGMSFSVLDNEGVYLNCFGTLDRVSGVVFAACDSAAVLETPLATPPQVLSDCDLDPILQVNLTIH